MLHKQKPSPAQSFDITVAPLIIISVLSKSCQIATINNNNNVVDVDCEADFISESVDPHANSKPFDIACTYTQN